MNNNTIGGRYVFVALGAIGSLVLVPLGCKHSGTRTADKIRPWLHGASCVRYYETAMTYAPWEIDVEGPSFEMRFSHESPPVVERSLRVARDELDPNQATF